MGITCAYDSTTFKTLDRSKILNYQKVPAFIEYLNSTHSSSPNAIHINEDPNVIKYYARDAFIGDASNTIVLRTIQGEFPSTHENHIPSLRICSNALTGDSLIMNNSPIK